MKRSLLAFAMAASLAFASGASIAADMPVKAPTYGPQQVAAFSWDGFYLGVHGGLQRDRSELNAGIANLELEPSGFFFGGQIGFNRHLSPRWVWGLEADFSKSWSDDSVALAPGVSANSEFDWQGTARLRLGYLISPQLMIFGTGGLAIGQIENSISAPGINLADSPTYVGWTVGGGMEWALSRSWSVRLQYLFRDYGSEVNNFTVVSVPVAVQTHEASLGINYRF